MLTMGPAVLSCLLIVPNNPDTVLLSSLARRWSNNNVFVGSWQRVKDLTSDTKASWSFEQRLLLPGFVCFLGASVSLSADVGSDEHSPHLPVGVSCNLSAGIEGSSLSQYQSRLHPDSDCLTPVWETLDAFLETDFTVPRANSSSNTAERPSPSAVNRFSQQFHTTLFHMDDGDCPKIRNTEFKALRRLVIGPALNFSGSCHWTAVVPEDQYISVAVKFGQCASKHHGNVLMAWKPIDV